MCINHLFWGFLFSKKGKRKNKLKPTLLHFSFLIPLSLYIICVQKKDKESRLQTKIAQTLASHSLQCCYDCEWYTWHYALSSETLVVAHALFMLSNQIVEIIFTFHINSFLFDKMGVLCNIKRFYTSNMNLWLYGLQSSGYPQVSESL